MRRLLTVLVILLPLAGCNADKPVSAPAPKAPTTSVTTPKPVTAVVVTKPKRKLLPDSFDTVEPNAHTPLARQILTRMELSTQQMAGFAAKTTARCPGLKLKPMATSECTVTYSGMTLKWRVQIGKDYKPGNWRTPYLTTPLQGVLFREAVYAAWYNQKSKGTEDVRCDSMPAVQVVKVDEPTPYRCEVLTKTVGGAIWLLAPVTMTRIGLGFFSPS